MKGTFKGWAYGKPFGFIETEGMSRDIFLHVNSVDDPMSLGAGSIVEFNPVDTAKGTNADVVKIITLVDPKDPLPTGISPGDIIKEGVEGMIAVWFDKGFGFVRTDEYKDNIFVPRVALPASHDGYLSEGDILRFDVVGGWGGTEIKNIRIIGWSPPEMHLLRFADMGHPDELSNLKEMAEKEDWFYRQTQSHYNYPILRSYLNFTFRRLQEMDNGIAYSPDEMYASFNTGLVTPNQEEIYAAFSKQDVSDRQPWRLAAFVRKSDRKFLDRFGANQPPLAEYFEDASDLIFDKRYELHISIDHVLERIERFPEHLRDNPYLARQLLLSAEAQTKKRVYRNYKTAIPQYFWDKDRPGSIQLLLPICLDNPAKADLALTAERTQSRDAYRASTVLTLDMAYNNARLLARPDTEWLQP